MGNSVQPWFRKLEKEDSVLPMLCAHIDMPRDSYFTSVLFTHEQLEKIKLIWLYRMQKNGTLIGSREYMQFQDVNPDKCFALKNFGDGKVYGIATKWELLQEAKGKSDRDDWIEPWREHELYRGQLINWPYLFHEFFKKHSPNYNLVNTKSNLACFLKLHEDLCLDKVYSVENFTRNFIKENSFFTMSYIKELLYQEYGATFLDNEQDSRQRSSDGQVLLQHTVTPDQGGENQGTSGAGSSAPEVNLEGQLRGFEGLLPGTVRKDDGFNGFNTIGLQGID